LETGADALFSIPNLSRIWKYNKIFQKNLHLTAQMNRKDVETLMEFVAENRDILRTQAEKICSLEKMTSRISKQGYIWRTKQSSQEFQDQRLLFHQAGQTETIQVKIEQKFIWIFIVSVFFLIPYIYFLARSKYGYYDDEYDWE
jgi:hypothetical protein